MRTIKRPGRIKRSIKRPQNMKDTTKGTSRKGTTKGTTRKGTTKHRKINRRMKTRALKTRRQSGGGFTSFITADDNPVAIPPAGRYADQIKIAKLGQKGKSGIDVKVELVDGNPKSWLIGGDGWSDATFGELERGAKDRRYIDFIDALKTNPLWELELDFTKPGSDNDSSKGIKLSHDQFCRLLINGPLDYPVLVRRFNDRGYRCSSESAPRVAPMSAAFRAPPPGPSALRAPPPGPSAAAAPQYAPLPPGTQYQYQSPPGPSAAPMPPSSYVTTKYLPELAQIKGMNLENVTDQMIANALNSAKGDADRAVAILLSAAADSGVSAAPGARGGPSAAPISAALRVAPSSAAPTRASINDFVQAQNGTFPRQLPQLSSDGSCTTYKEALKEINAGKKVSHWIWYIIPSSPGRSDISKFFGIGHANVTPEQYLSNLTLSARYVEILTAIGAKLQEFMTKPRNHDDVKQFLVKLMGGTPFYTVDYDKLQYSLAIFYPILFERKLVNEQISLLAHQLGVPQPTLGGIVQYVPPSTAQQYAEPGPSAALRVAPSSAALRVAPEWVTQLKGMSFGQDQIDQALSAGKTNAPDAMDYILANPLPDRKLPVEKLAFEPGIGDLMVPDLFVKKYADAYRLGFDQNESYQPDPTRNLSQFADRTKCSEVANWTVMQTVGDGNCLTHAFLQCMSSNYRKLHVNNAESQEEKIAVAQAFRLAFARIGGEFLNEGAKDELSTNNGLGYLSDATFASYANLFGVILVVFDVRQNAIIVANLTEETTAPIMQVIFVHGDGGHFSSVLPARVSHPAEPFVIKYADAIQSECLKKHLSLTNPIVFNL